MTWSGGGSPEGANRLRGRFQEKLLHDRKRPVGVDGGCPCPVAPIVARRAGSATPDKSRDKLGLRRLGRPSMAGGS